MVEGTRLLSECTMSSCTEGSNPSLSANPVRGVRCDCEPRQVREEATVSSLVPVLHTGFYDWDIKHKLH